jgi:hypothetical protein
VNKVEWRVAFAFDMARRAIVLAAAAKAGRSSSRACKQMIAWADARFSAHQAALSCVAPGTAKAPPGKGTRSR